MYLLDSGLKKDDQDQIKEGWEIIKLMVERIRNMVQDILFYAKERDLKWEMVDAQRFAHEVAQVAEPKVVGQQVEFVCDFEAGSENWKSTPVIFSQRSSIFLRMQWMPVPKIQARPNIRLHSGFMQIGQTSFSKLRIMVSVWTKRLKQKYLRSSFLPKVVAEPGWACS